VEPGRFDLSVFSLDFSDNRTHHVTSDPCDVRIAYRDRLALLNLAS